MRYRVDDALFDHFEVIGRDFVRSGISTGTRIRRRGRGDEGDRGIDLVCHPAIESILAHEFGRGQCGAAVLSGFDECGTQEVRGILAEGQETGDGGPVDSVTVTGSYARIAQEVEPGKRRRPAEERFETTPLQRLDPGFEDDLFIEHEAAAALLEQPGEFRWIQQSLRRADSGVVAASGGLVDEDSSRDFDDDDAPLGAGGIRGRFAPDRGTDRRFAVVRSDIRDPMLHFPEALLRNAGHGAGILDAQQEEPPVRVGQRDEFRCRLLGSRRGDALLVETDLLEFRSTVLTGPDPAEDLLSTL